MDTKNDKINFGVCIVVFGLLIGVSTTIHALYYAPQMEVVPLKTIIDGTATTSKSLIVSTSTPTRIVIPSIEVDTTVQPVGITFKGNMGVPNNFSDVGWYKYGTVPGNVGSAVMDGHVDNGLGMAAVFKHLKEIPIGGNIYVYTENGTRFHYVVTDIQTYYYTEVPLDFVFNTRTGSYLNLITCDGTWLSDAQTDDHRVVVYSKLVE